MKIAIGSDLHLEWGRGDFVVPECDLLILAGDIIGVWDNRKDIVEMYRAFFEECAAKAKNTVYVMGNHEHYNGDFKDTKQSLLTNYLNDHEGKVHLLDNNFIEIEGIVVYGATFWTDMNGSNPEVMWDAKRGMNDHYCISYGNISGYGYTKAKFLPEDAVNENFYARAKVREVCTMASSQGKDVIVVTHHLPSFLSVHERYSMEVLSYAYANKGLEDFILDSPEIKLWVHGHTHDKCTYTLGETVIQCNPRGYDVQGYEFLIMEM